MGSFFNIYRVSHHGRSISIEVAGVLVGSSLMTWHNIQTRSHDV